MKAALVGYGKMGRELEAVLRQRGHETVAILDNGDRVGGDTLNGAEVALEFSTPQSAFANVKACLEAGVPVVCGTTGWQNELERAREMCTKLGGTFFYSSNFSLGVNLFFAVSERLAELMNNFSQYGISIRETHHIHKKDSPSGTAVTLAEGILANIDHKTAWQNSVGFGAEIIGIESIREGEVFGIHEVKYDSPTDSIELIHSSKNRSGLALGAVMAAEYSITHKGILSMTDLLWNS